MALSAPEVHAASKPRASVAALCEGETRRQVGGRREKDVRRHRFTNGADGLVFGYGFVSHTLHGQ